MSTTTQPLASWLLEQIAADEAVAGETVAELSIFTDDPEFTVEWGWSVLTYHSGGGRGSHFADGAPSPEHVLAVCAAHRAIVEMFEQDLVASSDPALDPLTRDRMTHSAVAMLNTLRALAQPYADRPGFREEWRAH